MKTKLCSKCLQPKPPAKFRDEPLGKDGKRSICRECDRQYSKAFQARQRQERPDHVKALKQASYERRKDTILAKSRERYMNEREHRLQQAAEYRAANREYILAWHRLNYANNREAKLTKDRDYIKRNREKVAERRKQYRELHKAETRMRNRMRKAQLKFSNMDYTDDDWKSCIAVWNNCCAVCGRATSEERQICADHWVPLASGGLTHKLNILPLCHGFDGCNNKKHNKNPIDWLTSMLEEEQAQNKLAQIEAYFNSLS